MMIRRKVSSVVVWLGAGLLATSLAACSQQWDRSGAVAPQVQENRFTLTAPSPSVKASFLRGELGDMKVTEQVEQGTGKVVVPPKLQATLRLKNTSEDQAARLISGKIKYADAEGNLFPLGEGREDTSFKFYSYQQERLDPSMETTQRIEVPFPAAALKEQKLRDIRLELAYIPSPCREETVSVRVSLSQ